MTERQPEEQSQGQESGGTQGEPKEQAPPPTGDLDEPDDRYDNPTFKMMRAPDFLKNLEEEDEEKEGKED